MLSLAMLYQAYCIQNYAQELTVLLEYFSISDCSIRVSDCSLRVSQSFCRKNANNEFKYIPIFSCDIKFF